MNTDIPKQYIGINGRSILDHTLARLLQLDALKSIVVVLDEATYNAEQLHFNSPKIVTCIGGNSRAESVRNGLHVIVADDSASDMVLVHDAARPCVRVEDIKRLIDEVAGDENGGLLAMPVVDTIKCADDSLRVTGTIDRQHLWRAATPQLFHCQILLRALNSALDGGLTITDEASAMETAGYSPKLVQCSADNIKVTTPTDLALAEHYLATQHTESTDAQ